QKSRQGLRSGRGKSPRGDPEGLFPFLSVGQLRRAFRLRRGFACRKKGCQGDWQPEIDDKPPGSFRKKSARGCMFMGNKQIKEIRFGKLGGSQSLFLSSRGARPFF